MYIFKNPLKVYGVYKKKKKKQAKVTLEMVVRYTDLPNYKITQSLIS